MREIKFRCWNPKYKEFQEWGFMSDGHFKGIPTGSHMSIEDCWNYSQQYTGLRDKNGKEIYEGDILEFSDKWEWYKGKYGIRMYFAEHKMRQELQKEYESEPMERRVITMPECYEWILSTEIQTYWQVVGNIHENADLIQ